MKTGVLATATESVMASPLIQRLTRMMPTSPYHLRVSLIGPSGVGKTSLLATMCSLMEALLADADLQLTARPTDASRTVQAVNGLRRLFLADGIWVDPSMGVDPTREPSEFRFYLGRRGRRSDLMLQFCDFPGEWMGQCATDAEWEYVAGLVSSSDAVIIPIDAPALMEEAMWHHERNQPEIVYSLLQRAYTDLVAPRLVVLVPLRCERYMADPALRAKLLKRVREGYNQVLAFLAYGEMRSRVSVVIAPVQTTGGIEFVDSVTRARYQPRFAKSRGGRYEPRDGEQPLRYLLRFILRIHQDHRDSGYRRLVQWLLGGDEHLIAAMRQFANGSKTGQGFEILQGSEWLDLRSRP